MSLANRGWNFEGDQTRDTRTLHGHAMDIVGCLHRALVVRNYDELRALLEFLHQSRKGCQAELVERRVYLVHQAEGTRVQQEERENQRHRGECLLAAREQTNFL